MITMSQYKGPKDASSSWIVILLQGVVSLLKNIVSFILLLITTIFFWWVNGKQSEYDNLEDKPKHWEKYVVNLVGGYSKPLMGSLSTMIFLSLRICKKRESHLATLFFCKSRNNYSEELTVEQSFVVGISVHCAEFYDDLVRCQGEWTVLENRGRFRVGKEAR